MTCLRRRFRKKTRRSDLDGDLLTCAGNNIARFGMNAEREEGAGAMNEAVRGTESEASASETIKWVHVETCGVFFAVSVVLCIHM
jgi:hypothetical protein